MKEAAEWAKAIQSVFEARADVIPPGWKTARQIGDDQKLSFEHVSRLLPRLIKEGIVEVKKFRTYIGPSKTTNRRRGYYRPMPHYRLINRVKSSHR